MAGTLVSPPPMQSEARPHFPPEFGRRQLRQLPLKLPMGVRAAATMTTRSDMRPFLLPGYSRWDWA